MPWETVFGSKTAQDGNLGIELSALSQEQDSSFKFGNIPPKMNLSSQMESNVLISTLISLFSLFCSLMMMRNNLMVQ